MATVIQEVTKREIKALAAEASEHGDDAQYSLCVRALNGDDDARNECTRVILEARARAQ